MPSRTFALSRGVALGAVVAALTWGALAPKLVFAGDLRCVFEVTRVTTTLPPMTWPLPPVGEGPEADAKTTTRRTFVLNVGLGRDALICEEENAGAPSETVAYDFLARRATTLYPANATYRDTSLYAIVALRVNGLLNRAAEAAEAAAIRAARPAAERMPMEMLARYLGRFASESLFALRLPPGPPAPAEAPFLNPPLILAVDRDKGPGWDFHFNGEVVVQFTPSERRVPEELRRALRHFLAYRCSIHPDVRDKILDAGMVPGTLTFQYTDVGRLVDERVTLTLKVVGDDGERPIRVGAPKGHVPDVDPARPLDLILKKLNQRIGQVPRPDRATLAAFLDAALKRGDDLDAYLALCEYTAETGDPVEELAQRFKEADGPGLKALVAFEKPTAEDLELRIKTLDALDRNGLTKGHMIDALCASALTMLGRSGEAEPRFLKALDANPMLVDAYVTLGTSRFHAFQIEDAWQAFDAARRIDPSSPFLAEVKALEARLAADFPDEF